MVKGSDFAQKLLDDLRRRKEKLGFTHSSRQSAQSSASTYRSQERSSQVSIQGNASTLGTAEITKKYGTGYNKVPTLERPSQEIVPFTQGNRVEQTGDGMSMGLTFALGNNGKLQNVELFSNAMVGNKLIMHRGSIDFKKIEQCITNGQSYSTNHGPYLSDLQLGEISKCIDNLNKFLKLSSSKSTITRDSIDIGRELLRGAIDLEKSLGMLVTFQEASTDIVGPQKNNVKLLKGKEEESTSPKHSQHKLKNKNGVSFDMTSRSMRDLSLEECSQRTLAQRSLDMTLVGKPKVTKSSSKIASSSSTHFVSHGRSVSYDSSSKFDGKLSRIKGVYQDDALRQVADDFDNRSSKTISKTEKSSRSEKARVPSIVARLMGLEELPTARREVMGEIQKRSKANKYSEMFKNWKAGEDVSKDIELIAETKKHTSKAYDKKNKFLDGDNSDRIKIRNIEEGRPTDGWPAKVDHSNMEEGTTNFTASREASHGKDMASETSGSTDINERDLRPKDEESSREDGASIILESKYGKAISETRLAQVHTNSVSNDSNYRNIGIDKRGQYRETFESQSIKIQYSKEKIKETEATALNHYDKSGRIPTKHASSQSVRNDVSRDLISDKLIASKQHSGSSKLTSKHTGHTQDKKLGHKSSSTLQKRNTEKRDLKLKTGNEYGAGKNKKVKYVSERRNSLSTSTVELQENPPERSEAELDINKEINIIDHNPGTEERRDQDTGNMKPEMRTNEGKSTNAESVVEVHYNMSTLDSSTALIAVSKQEEGTATQDGPRKTESMLHQEEHLVQQPSLVNEIGEWNSKESEVAEETIAEGMMDFQQTLKESGEETSTTLSDSYVANGHEELPAAEENSSELIDKIINISSTSQKLDGPATEQDLQIHTSDLDENCAKDLAHANQLSSRETFEEQKQSGSNRYEQKSLIKDHYFLKHIVLSNKPITDTAKALFRIEVDSASLPADDGKCACHQQDNAKVLEDCVHELMIRKWEREKAISVSQMPSKTVRERCLDDLIIELNFDVESIQALAKTENGENSTAEHIQKLLEKDILDVNPDVNSFWDCSWNKVTFAIGIRYDIVRDLEKHILDGLINDLAEDLFTASITVL